MKIHKTRSRSIFSLAAVFAVMIAGVTYGNTANAGCGQYEQRKPVADAWRQEFSQGDSVRFMPATFMHVSTSGGDQLASIVGLWKFKMTAKGNVGIPDGAPIDFGYAAWHSDGTELMNSGARPPITGDFCMGAWAKVGPSSFKLNHVGLSWDGTGTVYVGPANIKEQVTVNGGGDRYSGVFSITQYAIDGTTVLAHIVGIVTADRVTAD